MANQVRIGTDMVARSKWKETGVSPFGFGFYYVSGRRSQLPFTVQPYHAEYMPPEVNIEMSSSISNLNEPMFFVLPPGISHKRLKELPDDMKYAMSHPIGVRRVTNLKVFMSDRPHLSNTAQILMTSGLIEISRGTDNYLELTFDEGRQHRFLDIRPVLPMIIRY